jgi:hypothetical protein
MMSHPYSKELETLQRELLNLQEINCVKSDELAMLVVDRVRITQTFPQQLKIIEELIDLTVKSTEVIQKILDLSKDFDPPILFTMYSQVLIDNKRTHDHLMIARDQVDELSAMQDIMQDVPASKTIH